MRNLRTLIAIGSIAAATSCAHMDQARAAEETRVLCERIGKELSYAVSSDPCAFPTHSRLLTEFRSHCLTPDTDSQTRLLQLAAVECGNLNECHTAIDIVHAVAERTRAVCIAADDFTDTENRSESDSDSSADSPAFEDPQPYIDSLATEHAHMETECALVGTSMGDVKNSTRYGVAKLARRAATRDFRDVMELCGAEMTSATSPQ